MGLKEIAKGLSAWETRRIACLGIDVRVKRLSVAELQEVERLTEDCTSGRRITDMPRLAHGLVRRWFTDAEGKPLAGDDTAEDAREWPGVLVSELMDAFNVVNSGRTDPN